MRKLMQLLGIVEDDEFEDIVAVFQTTVDKLNALVARKNSVAVEKVNQAIELRAQADALGIEASKVNEVIAQAEATKAKLLDILG